PGAGCAVMATCAVSCDWLHTRRSASWLLASPTPIDIVANKPRRTARPGLLIPITALPPCVHEARMILFHPADKAFLPRRETLAARNPERPTREMGKRNSDDDFVLFESNLKSVGASWNCER